MDQSPILIFFSVGEYNAELINIPEGYDWNKACRYIPIKIQDQTIEKPDVCERRVSTFLLLPGWIPKKIPQESRQYGKWVANNQLDCRPYWGPLRDVVSAWIRSFKLNYSDSLSGLSGVREEGKWAAQYYYIIEILSWFEIVRGSKPRFGTL